MAEANPTAEEWRDVVGYEGWYEVSNLGRIRNIKRRNGSRVGLILRQNPNGDGYASLGLRKDGLSTTWRVHILVLAAFAGPTPDGYEANHCDGNKMNPRLDNFEYLTHTDNVRHAIAMGLHNPSRIGAANGGAKLDEVAVRAIRLDATTAGMSYSALAAKYHVGKSAIWRVVTGATWSHLQ
jgi:hypothetical protein